jgi:magnesium chelatase subunit ChlI-like protein
MAGKELFMNVSASAVVDLIAPVLNRLAGIAPRPVSLEATGLSPELLADLTLKHLLRAGSLTSVALGERLGLVGPVIEPIVQFLRQEGRLQLQVRASVDNEVRLTLTERGRQSALDALRVCGYAGPAPVPIEAYSRVVLGQTIPRRSLARAKVNHAFQDIIMAEDLCDRLGVAIASGRAIFIYGPAGSGKTYIASRLIAALPGEVLIPHSVVVNGKIIRVFDAAVHEPIDLLGGNQRLLLAQGYDARFALCERPMIIVGGELTEDMLDVQFNSSTVEFSAPLQMKSNGGVLVIDDLGRQRFLPQRLFDRWIVPLEQKVDHLNAGVDARFVTPCDAVIVFSTNLEPTELADDAVLRRLGYKIELRPLSVDLYFRVWSSVCDEMHVDFEQNLLNYVLTKMYPGSKRPLLACHPRDLICMALDKASYDERGGRLEIDDLRWAWANYFLPIEDGGRAASRR